MTLGSESRQSGMTLEEVVVVAEESMSVNTSEFNIQTINGTENATELSSKYTTNMVNQAVVGVLDSLFSMSKYSIVQGYTYDGEIDLISMVRLITICFIIYILFIPVLIVSFLIVYGVRRIIRKKEGLKE
jgi:hypothetical protein